MLRSSLFCGVLSNAKAAFAVNLKTADLPGRPPGREWVSRPPSSRYDPRQPSGRAC
jgi:hypothetical protein